MNLPTDSATSAEPNTTAETPEPAPAAPVETPASAAPAPDVAAISAKAASDAIAAERQRVTDIRNWAKHVSAIQNINLDSAVDEFVANGKSFADFKEHVITNTFKPAKIVTATDSNGAAGRTMKRADFDKLDNAARVEFLQGGGKLTA